MKQHGYSPRLIIATAFAIGLGTSTESFADKPLPPVDSIVTTIFDKSVVEGSIAKDPATGMFAFDAAGNLMFNYTGTIYSVETREKTGELKKLEKAIGSIEGQAAFPMEFGMLAGGMKAYLDGVGKMPSVPAVIPWTCNSCTMKVGGSTYRSVVDMAEAFSPDGASDAMRMEGRAFTGLGPVEVGQLSAQSMSVRMAGCSAVVGIDGPHAGKLGTLCLNGTFTFDLAGINLSNMMMSDIVGYGTSNCTMVLHDPLPM
jgi:hypothetical protein